MVTDPTALIAEARWWVRRGDPLPTTLHSDALVVRLCDALEASEARRRELVEVLTTARAHFSGVDNGYCTICRGHRTYYKSNRLKVSAHPSTCERAECFSHVLDRALTDPPEGA